MGDSHENNAVFSGSQYAENYRKGRPGHPKSLVDAILKFLRVKVQFLKIQVIFVLCLLLFVQFLGHLVNFCHLFLDCRTTCPDCPHFVRNVNLRDCTTLSGLPNFVRMSIFPDFPILSEMSICPECPTLSGLSKFVRIAQICPDFPNLSGLSTFVRIVYFVRIVQFVWIINFV